MACRRSAPVPVQPPCCRLTLSAAPAHCACANTPAPAPCAQLSLSERLPRPPARRRVGMSTAPAGGPARQCAVHGFVVYSLRRRLRVVTKHIHLSRHSRDPRPASERRPRCGSANRQRPSGPAGITQVPVSRALVMPAGSRQCCSARMCSTVGEHRQHAPCMQARS